MSAVDERGIHISDMDHMQGSAIGADQAHVNVVNMNAHFATARGTGFQVAAPGIQPQQQPDLWAGTDVQARSDVLNRVDIAANNMMGAAPSMNPGAGVKMDGAGYLANSVGGMAMELLGGIGKEMQGAQMTPDPQLAMQVPQFRPGGGLFG